MPYVRRPCDRTGLAILFLGGVFALGATVLALQHPALRDPVHLDGANASFVLFGWLSLALVGNALWILVVDRPAFARRWWIGTALFVLILVGIGVTISWPLPLVVAAFAALLSIAAEILNLLQIPLGLAWLFVDSRKYSNSESFRLVKPRL